MFHVEQGGRRLAGRISISVRGPSLSRGVARCEVHAEQADDAGTGAAREAHDRALR